MLHLTRSRIRITAKEVDRSTEIAAIDKDLIQDLLETPLPLFDKFHNFTDADDYDGSYDTTPQTPDTSSKHRLATNDTILISGLPNRSETVPIAHLFSFGSNAETTDVDGKPIFNYPSRFSQLFDREGITSSKKRRYKSNSKYHSYQFKVKDFLNQRFVPTFFRLMDHLHLHY